MLPKRVAKKRSPPEDALPKSKKVKVSHRFHRTEPGLVLTLGQGDVGQLGLGENVMERKKPALVTIPEDIVQAETGGIHTVCLSKSGQVYSFGCNDEGALGRDTSVEGSEMVPGKVELQEKVVQASAGDSHTAALTEDGSFRDNNGAIGRLEPMKKSMGNPGHVKFQDAFCGTYFTFAISLEGHVYGFGLSNYHQLGTSGTESCFVPQNLTSFKNSTKFWVGFSGSRHHIVCMDSEGKAYSLGRAEYGRLGLGEDAEERSMPTLISRLPIISSVACGASVGYAVTKDGRVFAWGMGTNYQLGTGQEEDAWIPVEMTGKQLENRLVLSVSSGGQHTVLLVRDKQQS
ncbi:Regulator of chromosome condensation [Myotis brandtii]|uniref:Regulator of chromosome condensation n=1 Tax=Myotis brandtii TaxID=109478 RepID=S7NIP3_MYOBR|nr:Regulator of chromosome condensation [Myotis brandtii]